MLGAGKTAIQDIVLHLDPDLARHKAGRTIMQRLEDTYGDAGEVSGLLYKSPAILQSLLGRPKNGSTGA